MSFFYGTLALLYNWEGTPRSEVKSSNASKVLLNFSQKLWLWCENYLPGKRRQRRRKKAQTQKLLEQIFAFCLSNGQVHISQHILSYDLIG